MHLEHSIVIYGVYNSETLEDLIHTVHYVNNYMTEIEKLSLGEFNEHIDGILMYKTHKNMQ